MSDTQPTIYGKVRAICQHCKTPITYSAERMEWWHNVTAEGFRARGIQCFHPQPPNRAGAITRDGEE